MKYRHTQVGWQVYGPLIAGGLVVFALMGRDADVFGVLALVLAAVFVMFGWLTVDIDDRRLSIVFGLGLVRRRIQLSSIRAFASVRNAWWYGWGIRLTPHGILYNVSGLSAVEILLDDGRRMRVGTDEPEAFVLALQHATGIARSRSPDDFPADAAWRRRIRMVAVAVVTLLLVFIFGQLYLYSREPGVDLSGQSVSIGVGLHGIDIPISDINGLELVDTLPRIERRTNGFAARGLLRGNFRLQHWGNGRVFINHGTPPYIVLRTPATFVVVNYAGPDRTRELYRQLSAVVGHRPAASEP